MTPPKSVAILRTRHAVGSKDQSFAASHAIFKNRTPQSTPRFSGEQRDSLSTEPIFPVAKSLTPRKGQRHGNNSP